LFVFLLPSLAKEDEYILPSLCVLTIIEHIGGFSVDGVRRLPCMVLHHYNFTGQSVLQSHHQCQHHYFLPARRYASAGYRDRNVSVRLSVRPSRAGIVSKRRKL